MWLLCIIFVALCAVANIDAVSTSDFPQCALNCVERTTAEFGVNATDLSFICKSNSFLSSVESCEGQNCGPADLTRLFTLAIQLCEPVGGTNHIGLFNLSTCAQPGLDIATSESGCSPTNWTCICQSQAYTVVAAAYEDQYCSPADRQAILDFTSTACAAVGVQLVPPTPGASNITALLTSPEPSVYKLPDCAQPCVDAALLQSGCAPTDWECICVNPAFVGGSVAFCELQACSIADQYSILNYTGTQCSAVGEALVPSTTIPQSSSNGTGTVAPLQAATVPLVFPTGNVPGAVPPFSSLPECAQFCAMNATSKIGGSVTDLNLLCKSRFIGESIGACEPALCSLTDQITALILSGKQCEPLGGVASINPTINPSAQSSLLLSAALPTTTAVTDLASVPACAKPCLVDAFRQSSCALEDVQCQCKSQAFRSLFSTCQAAACGILDLQRLLPFTIQRCQAVGIPIPASIISIESDIAFGRPVSTDIIPTPTNLANAPNDIESLPFCAQECIYEAASVAACDIHNLTCLCTSEIFVSYAETCETASCTGSERQVISAYSAALCLPVRNALNFVPTGAAPSSYLVEATYSAPNPPAATNAPNNISAFPICAQSCIYGSAAAANCSSINDLTCICQNQIFVSSVGRCEMAVCSSAEIEVVFALAQNVCQPVGGFTPASFTSGAAPNGLGELGRRGLMALAAGWLGWVIFWVGLSGCSVAG